jgi:hypothetical protein
MPGISTQLGECRCDHSDFDGAKCKQSIGGVETKTTERYHASVHLHFGDGLHDSHDCTLWQIGYIPDEYWSKFAISPVANTLVSVSS